MHLNPLFLDWVLRLRYPTCMMKTFPFYDRCFIQTTIFRKCHALSDCFFLLCVFLRHILKHFHLTTKPDVVFNLILHHSSLKLGPFLFTSSSSFFLTNTRIFTWLTSWREWPAFVGWTEKIMMFLSTSRMIFFFYCESLSFLLSLSGLYKWSFKPSEKDECGVLTQVLFSRSSRVLSTSCLRCYLIQRAK